MGALRALVALLVAVELSCSSATLIRYRLPLAGNPGAAACFADCSTLRSTKDDETFLRCLSTCPNLEQTVNARCDLDAPGDRPPVATCVTARAPKLGSARHAVGALILGMTVFLLGFVYIDNRRS